MARMPLDEETGYSPTQHDLSGWRAFNLSLARLDPANPVDSLACALLARAAYFAPGQTIPRQLLLATLEKADKKTLSGKWKWFKSLLGLGTRPSHSSTPEQQDQALNRLTSLGLLAGKAEEGLSLHHFLARFIRAGSPGEGQTLPPFSPEALAEAQAAVEATLLAEARRLIRAGDPRPLLAWQAHLQAVTEAALTREDKQAANLSNALGYYLQMRGDYAGARPYYEQDLAISEKVLGPEHPDTATSLNNLAVLYAYEEQFSKAVPLMRRAIAIWEATLGPEHPDTQLSRRSLAAMEAAEKDEG